MYFLGCNVSSELVLSCFVLIASLYTFASAIQTTVGAVN